MFRGNTHPYVTKGQKDRDFPFDLWLALVVNVASKPRDIYDALDQLFDPEIVDTEDGKCERYGALGMLPPILQIHVQRTMFDKEKGQSYKSDHHLKFPERIFMGRYWEQGSYTLAGPKYTYLEKRYKRWDLKKKLGLLQAKTDELTKNMVSRPLDASSHFADNPRNQLSKHGGKSMIGSASHILNSDKYCINELGDSLGGTSVVPDGLPKELEDCDFELMTKLFGKRSLLWNHLCTLLTISQNTIKLSISFKKRLMKFLTGTTMWLPTDFTPSFSIPAVLNLDTTGSTFTTTAKTSGANTTTQK